MMIDSHCHLFDDEYNNIDDVIHKMGNNIIIVSGTNQKTNEEVLLMCKKYKNVYGTIGIHPTEINEEVDKTMSFIEEHINDDKIVGVGEIGLDFYWNKKNKDEQKLIFIKQIKMAKKYNKTFVVHSRDALEETYNILKQEQYRDMRAVLHCYTGNVEMANKLTDLKIKLGIGGIVTFKNGKELKEVVKEMDLKYLLLETDSPYLSPEPFRGKQNEPANILFIAKKIAEIKGVAVDYVMDVTTRNAITVFDLKL